jgi:hypothetical protein
MSLTFGLTETTLVGLGVLMTLTNPEPKAYEQYAAKQIDAYLKENVCAQLSQGLGGVLNGQCKTMVDVARPQLEEAIALKTKRRNFILFSIYQTELSLPSSASEYQFTTLGLLQNFFVYQTE